MNFLAYGHFSGRPLEERMASKKQDFQPVHVRNNTPKSI